MPQDLFWGQEEWKTSLNFCSSCKKSQNIKNKNSYYTKVFNKRTYINRIDVTKREVASFCQFEFHEIGMALHIKANSLYQLPWRYWYGGDTFQKIK